MKDKLAKLEADQNALMERLGIDSLEDLDLLPDAKGAAEAAKQYDAKLKRLERQLQEATTQRDEISGKFRGSFPIGQGQPHRSRSSPIGKAFRFGWCPVGH